VRRVQQLLKETESYLHKLGEKLATVTRQARDAAQGEGLAAAELLVVETTGAASPVQLYLHKLFPRLMGKPLGSGMLIAPEKSALV
jgi:hypothetical protein